MPATLRELIRPGMRVALGDGTATPAPLHAELCAAAAAAGDVEAVLGWFPTPAPGFDPAAFARARCVAGGPGLRAAVDAGVVAVTPCRLSAVPSLLHGPLRPDLLVTTLVRGADGYRMGADAGWMRGLVEAGVPVAALVSRSAPHADAGPPLPDGAVTVVGEVDGDAGRPAAHPAPDPGRRRGGRARGDAGARGGPGAGRSGAAGHGAAGGPAGAGADRLGPAAGPGRRPRRARPAARRSGVRLPDRHPSPARLGARPAAAAPGGGHPRHRAAVLTGAAAAVRAQRGLEIDVDEQVNVEGIGTRTTGLIGGHPDFAAAGARSRDGLSVIALGSAHRDHPTLVTRLSRPVTAPAHDAGVVVTERGAVDLRGLDRSERRAALRDLWGDAVHDTGPALPR